MILSINFPGDCGYCSFSTAFEPKNSLNCVCGTIIIVIIIFIGKNLNQTIKILTEQIIRFKQHHKNLLKKK